LVSVSVDDVRDVINVSSAEVPDAKVLKMLKRAEVTLELETDKEIDYSNCTDAEKEFITVSQPYTQKTTKHCSSVPQLLLNKRNFPLLNKSTKPVL